MQPSINQAEPELQVILPAELQDFYSQDGYVPSTMSEDRIHARLRVRRQGIIEFINTPPALRQAVESREARSAILVKDLSRCGLAFLYHEHVYPSEEAQVFLSGRRLHISVRRCRRIGPACYEIGANVDQVVSESTDT